MVPGDQSMSVLIGPGIVSDYTGREGCPHRQGAGREGCLGGLLAAHVSLVEAAGPDLQGTE